MIVVEHIAKSFGSITAVADLSFSVKKGEIVGLLGPNAAESELISDDIDQILISLHH